MDRRQQGDEMLNNSIYNKEGGYGTLVYVLCWCVNAMINKACQKHIVRPLYNLLFRCEASRHRVSCSTQSGLCSFLSLLGQEHPTESSILFLCVPLSFTK